MLQVVKLLFIIDNSLAALRGGGEGRALPPGAKVLSFSCSFWENMAKSYVGAARELAPPPRGNPGSATVINGLPGKTELFVMSFKLAQLVKFDLALT